MQLLNACLNNNQIQTQQQNSQIGNNTNQNFLLQSLLQVLESNNNLYTNNCSFGNNRFKGAFPFSMNNQISKFTFNNNNSNGLNFCGNLPNLNAQKDLLNMANGIQNNFLMGESNLNSFNQNQNNSVNTRSFDEFQKILEPSQINLNFNQFNPGLNNQFNNNFNINNNINNNNSFNNNFLNNKNFLLSSLAEFSNVNCKSNINTNSNALLGSPSNIFNVGNYNNINLNNPIQNFNNSCLQNNLYKENKNEHLYSDLNNNDIKNNTETKLFNK